MIAAGERRRKSFLCPAVKRRENFFLGKRVSFKTQKEGSSSRRRGCGKEGLKKKLISTVELG